MHVGRKVNIQKTNKREKCLSCSVYAYRGIARYEHKTSSEEKNMSRWIIWLWKNRWHNKCQLESGVLIICMVYTQNLWVKSHHYAHASNSIY